MRLCRPGSICGPQQQYLLELEDYLFKSGDMYRLNHNIIWEPDNFRTDWHEDIIIRLQSDLNKNEKQIM